MYYVIGDVHGCYDELMKLISIIENQDDDAKYIFVGDFIDRGPKTPQIMDWVVKNITIDGKFRSVRGNHEQDALEWYKYELLPFLEFGYYPVEMAPETKYDLGDVFLNHFHGNDKEIASFMDIVEKAMPYNLSVEIVSVNKVKQTYRICHGWHDFTERNIKLRMSTNLYRRHYTGNYVNEEIIVHGHTPTVDLDYCANSKDDRPGLIVYRHNAINVDGGCCYAKKMGIKGALCAICLENLREFYAFPQTNIQLDESSGDDESQLESEASIYGVNVEGCNRKSLTEIVERNEMLRKLGIK